MPQRSVIRLWIGLLWFAGACGGDGSSPPDASQEDAGGGGVDATGPDGGGTPPDAGADAMDSGPTEPLPACGLDTETAACAPEGGGETVLYVVDRWRVAAADPMGEPNVVPGFNLDGVVSGDTDADSCFHADYVSGPPDDIEGVDSRFGPTLVSLSLDDNFDRAFREAIAAGELLLLLELSDLNDPVSDACVHVRLLYGVMPEGAGTPVLDAEGRLVVDQVLDVDAASLMADGETALTTFMEEAIADGRLLARVPELELRMPIPPDDLIVSLLHHNGHLATTLAGERLTDVVLGGAVPRAEVTVEVGAVLEPALLSALDAVLAAEADLNPFMGGCMCASAGYVMGATRAVRGAVVSTR